MKKALDAVKIAEAKARALIEDSEKEARAIIAKAEQDSENHIEEAKGLGELEGKKLVEMARAKAKEQSVRMSEEHQKSVDNLKQQAAGKMHRAVDLIVERIVKAHGDS